MAGLPDLEPYAASARKQSKLLNCDSRPDFEMLYIRKEEHCDLIELANLCAVGDGKTEHLICRDGLDGELGRFAGEDRLEA